MPNGLNVYNTLSFRKFCPPTHNLFQTMESDKSFSELRIKKSFNLSWFITEHITVLINFNLEKLRSLAADVIGAI